MLAMMWSNWTPDGNRNVNGAATVRNSMELTQKIKN